MPEATPPIPLVLWSAHCISLPSRCPDDCPVSSCSTLAPTATHPNETDELTYCVPSELKFSHVFALCEFLTHTKTNSRVLGTRTGRLWTVKTPLAHSKNEHVVSLGADFRPCCVVAALVLEWYCLGWSGCNRYDADVLEVSAGRLGLSAEHPRGSRGWAGIDASAGRRV
jgi:hypothetical protein